MPVIDLRIQEEHKLSLEEARPFLGTNGKRSDFSTVYRAVTKGNTLPDGRREYLAVVRIGGAGDVARSDRPLHRSFVSRLERGVKRHGLAKFGEASSQGIGRGRSAACGGGYLN